MRITLKALVVVVGVPIGMVWASRYVQTQVPGGRGQYPIQTRELNGFRYTGNAIVAESGNVAVYASNTNAPTRAYLASRCCSGDFYGNVYVHGNLSVEGAKQFIIDSPLDPANKYLYHASVESSEMKNIYDGVVTLNAEGAAAVELPEWFSALNKNFRYQLTAIGAPGPGLHIAKEIKDNRFTIAGGSPGMRVSWMVSGVRQDAWAKANAMANVEQWKPSAERGSYLYPQGFDAGQQRDVEHARYPISR